MRWSIIRLIWARELRDQLRDRRTLFMIVVLPMLMYPVLGIVVVKFASGFNAAPSTIGIARGSPAQGFPPQAPRSARLSPVPIVAWFSLVPRPTNYGGLAGVAGAAALAQESARRLDYPLLIDGGTQFTPQGFFVPTSGGVLVDRNIRIVFLADDGWQALLAKQVDVVLVASPDFWSELESGAQPEVRLQVREGDERSRQAAQRLYPALARWKKLVTEVRLARHGLPSDFDEPLTIVDPAVNRLAATAAAESLFGLMIRIFPFLLVMWSLAGALYPAIDVCAGEKERGTMETLLISPAGRAEIVLGKFLTIWVFSAGTAVLNLISMGVSSWQFSEQLPQGALSAPAVAWCMLLDVPLSAFFSAISLAIGAYARSSKEGQYYLMPLFLVTMPLIFLTLAPGVELNPFYCMVPVTGVALLMQRLITATGLEQVPWLYFGPVLAPVALYSWLALRWAIDLFQREEVLFREAERLDVGLWLRGLFRHKEPRPTAGQALFCFAALLALSWLSFGLGNSLGLLVRNVIVLLAFVATPPLLMALLLTTRPRMVLSLRQPHVAYVLAAILLVPLAELAYQVMSQFPALMALLRGRIILIETARLQDGGGQPAPWWQYALVLAVLPAVCKEMAFRGFILSGLRRRFPPGTAIMLSGFLFAVFHMNVFMLAPAFLLGAVLGILALRSGSVLPGIVLSAAASLLLVSGPILRPGYEDLTGSVAGGLVLLAAMAAVCTAAAGLCLRRLGQEERRPALAMPLQA
jgi:sodium transport system permease protein